MLGGLWEFPGGKVDAGESDEQALRRELREDLGIEIGATSAFHTLKHAYSHFKITLAAYTSTLKSGDPKPLASKELKWVTVDELEHHPFPKANRTLTLALRDERA
jgi:A/G-specific adenine glycosylase